MHDTNYAYHVRPTSCLGLLLGSSILAFGLYEIHSLSQITEGGTLGMTLLLQHWFSISPALSGLLMNGLCYLIGWKTLGKGFLIRSAICAGSFSVVYWLCEFTPPLWPELTQHPLVAAILGALFVGVGVGLCVRSGGAPSGDDALAMSLSRLTGLPIQWMYLITDLTVLLLSASYIPWQKLVCSLLTVVLSGQIIGLIQRPFPKNNRSTG